MHVVTVANNKGGVGKTTLAMHLGCALADKGIRVLLVDADPQATLTRRFRLNEPQEGLSELVQSDYGESHFIHDLLLDTDNKNLRVLPAGITLEKAYAQMQGLAINRLRDALDDLSDTDLVVIDSPPRLGSVAEALLVAADSVLYAVDGAAEALVALQKLGTTVARVQRYRPSLSVLGVVVTQHKKANATHRLVTETLEQLYGESPIQGAVPESAFVLQAEAKRSTVFELAKGNRGAQRCAAAYTQIANQLAEALHL